MNFTRFWRWQLQPEQPTIESVVPVTHAQVEVSIVDGVVRLADREPPPARTQDHKEPTPAPH